MTAKTKTECHPRDLCHYESLTRTKFFHGMLLTDEHLRAEQTYHREALKRLNRHLWGAGIVCGLEVSAPPAGLCIRVHPGLALDCDGNVIEVCKGITIDLSDICKKAYPDGCAPDTAKDTEGGITKYLVLRYREIPADPQQVLTPDDDCIPPGEGPKCEASKYREGFCLELRDECPDCEPCGEKKDGFSRLRAELLSFLENPREYQKPDWQEVSPPCMDSPPCPDCHCDDGAVGLAKLVIKCGGSEVKVTCEDCRRYVWSPRLLQWLICELLGNIDRRKMASLKPEAPVATARKARPPRVTQAES